MDDDISVRESLESLIRSRGWSPETFTSADEFLARPLPLAPSCLVLDFALPGLNGLELQTRLAADRPYIPIIFLTGCGDIPMTVQAMKAGAVEFLTKPFSNESRLNAIRKAIDRSRAKLDSEAKIQALQVHYSALTIREREVMELVVSGIPNKQVGDELGITEITLKFHRWNVMRKMQAESFAELVNVASRLRIKGSSAPKAMVAR